MNRILKKLIFEEDKTLNKGDLVYYVTCFAGKFTADTVVFCNFTERGNAVLFFEKSRECMLFSDKETGTFCGIVKIQNLNLKDLPGCTSIGQTSLSRMTVETDCAQEIDFDRVKKIILVSAKFLKKRKNFSAKPLKRSIK